jgi:hypothetical protein
MSPTMTPITDRACGWALWDRHGEAAPCGKPATHRVSEAIEGYNGDFCAGHARQAIRYSKRAARRENEWR